mmetsp:Transcript_24773/g.51511  ORF Transcript_24773/g.51511 Transcript_24773/m.51511 type:complete len:486 (-) Transcript_24773:254-1711(-)|eukprot:CAMPEP_0172439924 /NCGR_PEP_ID=MMETSP1065-20121228/763_1 /TAXON_ID=265537 /ORGANISM="Amphiprora paludosa, Strain CCMP125" /LENGTH=485 /DNA_ID=CAMNT_0013188691 /DNA_START=223 /DNA_END=1680 /DNA_ORIENTATION=-
MDSGLSNTGGGNGADANLQLLLELQRQQQQQNQQTHQQQTSQQLQQQTAQLQQQQQQQQNALLQQQQQQSGMDQGMLPALQALLMQQRQQQNLNQASLQLGLGGGLSHQPFGGSADLGASLQHRENNMANQLLMRQQNVDELLAAASRPPASQQQFAAMSPLSALFSNPGDALQQALQLQMGAAAGVPGAAEALLAVKGQTPRGGEMKDTSGKESTTEQSEDSKAANVPPASAAAPAGAKKEEESSVSDVDDAEGADDEEDHPANDTFPFKLHRMLEHAEKNDMDDVISFAEEGKSFSIHKPREFVAGIMPKYFTTSRMSSFQRQLNLYGFRRVTEGRDKGSYFHKYFIKGRRGLCKRIKRKKASTKTPQAYDPGLASSMSIRQLLAERQFGSAYPGLSASLAAVAAGGAGMGGAQMPTAGGFDPNLLANAQLNQQLEMLVRQKQEETRLQQQQQQQQDQQQQQQQLSPYRPFPPGGGNAGGTFP